MSGFTLDALPYGVMRTPSGDRVVTRLGDDVIDVTPIAHVLEPDAVKYFNTPTLNTLMAAGPTVWAEVRAALQSWLGDPVNAELVAKHSIPITDVNMVLPVHIGDYVDFYSSRDHAENVGKMFRPDQPPLLPNWLHLPVGYHGKAGTVIVSGADVRRPKGQRKPPDADEPVFAPCARLDIEAEMGFYIGIGSDEPISVDDFAHHVFGVSLVNDWSARDIQAWEYVPLGPFLAKSFATSVSAWVTPLAAFEHAHVPAPTREKNEFAYLTGKTSWGLDIQLEVELNGEVVSKPPFDAMYWNAAQQLAHMTINGASTRTGDLFASGTISGPEKSQRGSFLELSWGGTEPITLADGTTRTFLEDGDTVRITATAAGPNGTRFALGDVSGTITPAKA